MRRKKILLSLCLCFTLIFAGLIYYISESVIVDGMKDAEVSDIKDGMLQLHSYIHALEMQMSLLALDWSCWDAAYRYVGNKNDDFVESSFSAQSMRKLGLSSAAIYKKDESLLYYICSDESLQNSLFSTEEKKMFKDIVHVMNLGDTEKIDGFLLLQDKPFIVSAHKIFDSKKEKVSDGILIITTKFDHEYVNNIQHMEKYNFSVLPAKYFTHVSLSYIENCEFKIYQTETETRIYSLISDVFGMNAFCLELKQSRDLAMLARKMAWKNFSLLLCFGLILVCACFLLLHKAEIRVMQREVAYRTGHDSLTGLVNKTLLPERLANFISRVRPEGLITAIFYIDLNRFKIVNDSYGHDQGDILLRAAAFRLRNLSGNGVVARTGGDKFLIVSACTDLDEVAQFAERVLDVLHEPFLIKGNTEVHVGASIGVSCAPNDGEDPRLLIHRAELAMHQSKMINEDDFAFFSLEMEEAATKKLQMESALYNALENKSLLVFYQPKINILARDVAGCEALVRWKKDDKFIPPPVFIPLAEECGLVTDVDMFVLRGACRQVKHWDEEGIAVPVAVNMSAHSILSDGFAAHVQQILREEAVPFSLIELEITESCFMNNLEQALAAITELSEAGIHIALDDFGTGYSSLKYLSAMPISCLKIDKSFVDDIFSGKEAAQPLVKSIISLAASLGMKTVSEGVEDKDQLAFLVGNGSHIIQGYLFSKPLSAADCSEFLRNRKSHIAQVMQVA